jgi:hypothetical protein
MGRYTQVTSNTLHPTEMSEMLLSRISKTTVNPIRIIVTFEETSKWPDDLMALRYVKRALLCNIGNIINANVNGMLKSLIILYFYF